MHDRIANCGHAPHLRTKGFRIWLLTCSGEQMALSLHHLLHRAEGCGLPWPLDVVANNPLAGKVAAVRFSEPSPPPASATPVVGVIAILGDEDSPKKNPRARARSVVSWCTCRRTDSPSAHSERRPQGRYERMRVGADGGRRAVLLAGLAPSTDQIPQPPSLRMCGPAEAPRSTRRYG